MAPTLSVRRGTAAMAIVLVLEVGARVLFPRASTLTTTLWLRLVQLAAMALLLRNEFTSGKLGSLHAVPLTRALVRGAVWSAGFGALAGIGALALAFMGLDPLRLIHMNLPTAPSTLALFFFTGGLVAPIAEELFFRGLLYTLLRPTGVVPALVLSTLCFAGAHAAGGLPVTQIAGGLLFAAAFEKEGHIAVPILIHGAGNTALFTLSLI